MKKISVIFGTRPEAIKLCPIIRALKDGGDMDCNVCVTGQHREMLKQVLDVFDVVPDTDLALMQPVEAGLRTWNLESPWPEEANRVLTTRLARWHFCPTESNKRNLMKEGVDERNIHVTGNTVIDALLMAKEMVRKNPPAIEGVPQGLMSSKERMVLITGHRRENFGDGFEHICKAIRNLANRFPMVHFVYPVHLNPHVREPVERILGAYAGKNIHLIAPQSYLPFVALMDRAAVILTDSGGVQEEAPSLGKPVLVMRDTTERPEAVEAGTVRLVGTEADVIESATSELLTDDGRYESMAKAVNPYGDGQAVRRILDVLHTEN